MTCATYATACATPDAAIGPRGIPLADIDNTPCRPHGHLPSAFLTPPGYAGPGWYSVWEFLAITDPAALALSDVAKDWWEAVNAAIELSRREGVALCMAPSPAVLADDYDIANVVLFPDAILRDVFPTRQPW